MGDHLAAVRFQTPAPARDIFARMPAIEGSAAIMASRVACRKSMLACFQASASGVPIDRGASGPQFFPLGGSQTGVRGARGAVAASILSRIGPTDLSLAIIALLSGLHGVVHFPCGRKDFGVLARVCACSYEGSGLLLGERPNAPPLAAPVSGELRWMAGGRGGTRGAHGERLWPKDGTGVQPRAARIGMRSCDCFDARQLARAMQAAMAAAVTAADSGSAAICSRSPSVRSTPDPAAVRRPRHRAGS